MMKKSLSSTLGQFFALISYISLIIVVGVILYSIIAKDLSGVIVGLIFVSFNYIIFVRKLLRASTISFDKDYFYFKDETKIELSQIQHIQDGEIIYLDNGIEKTVFVNPFFPSKNHRLFYKYFKLKK